MFDLFIEGGPLFMGILTIIFLVSMVLAVRAMMKFSDKTLDLELARKQLAYVRSLGILAFVVGVFGQLIGLYQAFIAIQAAGDISPALIFGGLRVSMITTLYGTFIFIVCLVLWMVLDARLHTKDD